MFSLNISYIFLLLIIVRLLSLPKIKDIVNLVKEPGNRDKEINFIAISYSLIWIILFMYLWLLEMNSESIMYVCVAIPLLFISVLFRRIISIVSITKLEKIYIADNIIIDSLYLFQLVIYFVVINVPTSTLESQMDKALVVIASVVILISSMFYSLAYEASERKINSVGARSSLLWRRFPMILGLDYKIKFDFILIFVSSLAVRGVLGNHNHLLDIVVVLVLVTIFAFVRKKVEHFPLRYFSKQIEKNLIISCAVVLMALLVRVVFWMAS